jgi:hypothetical protein
MPPADTADAITERVVQSFESLPVLAAADADLVRRGRFLTCNFEIGVGSVPLSVSVVEGRVASVRRGPFPLKPHTFSIAAEADVWLRFHRPFPEPGDHDLLVLTKTGRARVSGELVPLMGNLQYVKDLLALPRNRAKTETAS